jgi:hypothetical protein
MPRKVEGRELPAKLQEIVKPIRADLVRKLKEIDPKLVLSITVGGKQRSEQFATLLDPHTDLAKDTFKDKFKDGDSFADVFKEVPDRQDIVGFEDFRGRLTGKPLKLGRVRPK